jgi:hypothetical protein
MFSGTSELLLAVVAMAQELYLACLAHFPVRKRSRISRKILINRFRPGLFHSLIGLLTTIANIFSAQGGHLSVTAKVTICVTTICGGCMLILVGIYSHLANRIITETDVIVSKKGRPQSLRVQKQAGR